MQTCNFSLGSTWTQNLNQAGEVQGGAGDELEVICKGIVLEPARPSTEVPSPRCPSLFHPPPPLLPRYDQSSDLDE